MRIVEALAVIVCQDVSIDGLELVAEYLRRNGFSIVNIRTVKLTLEEAGLLYNPGLHGHPREFSVDLAGDNTVFCFVQGVNSPTRLMQLANAMPHVNLAAERGFTFCHVTESRSAYEDTTVIFVPRT